jgi:hypothetical protein
LYGVGIELQAALSQRALARQLGVLPSYVCKVQKQSAKGLEMLTGGSV